MVSIANVGQTDKLIRLFAGIILIAVSLMQLGGIGTTLGMVSFIVGGVLIVTGLFNFCPAYKIFSISSLSKSK